ncbi:DUF4136 domain-containing protein [Pacificimonas sp. WHA3]|uniref:DUF4136 domain-containing protein n=1 Tax=Pacificimonas pallii TaxID=2827236 RepID=A0ABS6SC71_9SPHN|nr:DUF4136 domain-containing protein [Pacificimonas pallii]MBV7255521.1 DUF4136 domain-containing protein [Pacificimonas pallii]
MTRNFIANAMLPVAALALLGACTAVPGGTDVTRFHSDAPQSRGTVYLEPVVADWADTLQFRQYAGAVAAELSAAGFTPVRDRDGADLIGAIDYAQNTREAIGGRSPVSIGVGGGTFGRRSGISLGTSLGLGGKPKDVKVSMLELRLSRASDGQPIWEGRAVTEAKEGSEAASLSAAIPALAADLLRDFPGPSGETVTYKAN